MESLELPEPIPHVLWKLLVHPRMCLGSIASFCANERVELHRVSASVMSDLQRVLAEQGDTYSGHVSLSAESALSISLQLLVTLSRLRYQSSHHKHNSSNSSSSNSGRNCRAVSMCVRGPVSPSSTFLAVSHTLLGPHRTLVLRLYEAPTHVPLPLKFNALCHELFRPRLAEPLEPLQAAHLVCTFGRVPFFTSFPGLDYSLPSAMALTRMYGAPVLTAAQNLSIRVPLCNTLKVHFLSDVAVCVPISSSITPAVASTPSAPTTTTASSSSTTTTTLNSSGSVLELSVDAGKSVAPFEVEVQHYVSTAPLFHCVRRKTWTMDPYANADMQLSLALPFPSLEPSAPNPNSNSNIHNHNNTSHCDGIQHVFHAIRLVPRLLSQPLRTPIESGLLLVFRAVYVPEALVPLVLRDFGAPTRTLSSTSDGLAPQQQTAVPNATVHPPKSPSPSYPSSPSSPSSVTGSEVETGHSDDHVVPAWAERLWVVMVRNEPQFAATMRGLQAGPQMFVQQDVWQRAQGDMRAAVQIVREWLSHQSSTSSDGSL